MGIRSKIENTKVASILRQNFTRCFECEETAARIIFVCAALAWWRENLLGSLDPEEELLKKDLVNRLLNLIKEADLFAS